jgi:DNA replication licensing factor MCM5
VWLWLCVCVAVAVSAPFSHTRTTRTSREQLRRHYNLGEYRLEVDLDDMHAYKPSLAALVRSHPGDFIQVFEDAATDAADQITAPRPEGQAVVDIQVTLKSREHPLVFRDLGVSEGVSV